MVVTIRTTKPSRRNKVAAAARNAWPGNNIPTFRNDSHSLTKLDELVKGLVPDCATPFFGEKAIRRHIIDTLTERRRRVKKGYSYEEDVHCKYYI